MVWLKRIVVANLLFWMLTGCQTLMPNFENPTVEIVSIKLLPNTGLAQNFEVGLKVSNPNSMSLALKGMSYSVSVDGYKLASGMAANIPVIEGYGSTTMAFPVSTSLMNGLRLVQSLMQNNNRELNYLLEAKLDTGMAFMPKITVVEEGKLPFITQ